MNLSVQEIALACGAKHTNAAKYHAELNAAMTRFHITTPRQIAAFLATVAVESDNLSTCEESLYYKDATRLAALYQRAFKNAAAAEPYTRNSAALSTLLYKGYHGRGLIQLTWQENYKEAGEALGYDYVGRPELLLQPKHAALTAAWYWAKHGCNEAAERGDMKDVTRRVNGPKLMHLAERTEQYAANMQWLGKGVLA